MKMAQPHAVPPLDQVIGLLRQLRVLFNASTFLFRPFTRRSDACLRTSLILHYDGSVTAKTR
jgi:hypothetical protein